MGRLIGRAMRRSNFQMYQYIDLLMGPFNSGKIESPIGGISLDETGVSVHRRKLSCAERFQNHVLWFAVTPNVRAPDGSRKRNVLRLT